MNDKIKQLQAQIALEQQKMAGCQHEFQKPCYDPETVREPYGYQMIAQGSDVYYEPQGYQDKKVDRWTRTCCHCGFQQHTKELQPIIKGHEPKF